MSERLPTVIILGAGRGVRGTVPSAVVELGEGSVVLDWLLDAFEPLGQRSVCFVGGYRADDVIERYPRLRTVLNRDWTTTGPARSLALAPLHEGGEVYVCYADAVFRRRAVEQLRAAPGDLVVAVDRRWRDRYDGRGRAALDQAEKVRLAEGRVLAIGREVPTSRADAEFTGLMRLSESAAGAVLDILDRGGLPASASMPDLLSTLLDTGAEVTAVDLAGDWAELDAKQDLARFVLGTKAESLERLRAMDHGGNIGDLVAFTRREWQADPDAVVGRVLDHVAGSRLIVRSSALTEDSWDESSAGRYESVLDVERSPERLVEAVERVLASYPPGADHQVLVQAMLDDVAVSGVIMTRTHTSGAPYYVVNFDDSSRRTDTVTGGAESRTIFVHRDLAEGVALPPALVQALATVQNVEKLVGHDSLDIEFAVTGDERVHILQVRPIVTRGAPEPIDDRLVASALLDAQSFLRSRVDPPPTLVGGSTRYSVMTDWNPAEIVGTKPRRLALSLYRYLVTDEVWARQRAEYGYRDVRPCPLLVDIVGHPYVDVRATFNSFVPASLGGDLAAALVDHYLDVLRHRPSLHDKVEFDVLFTCLVVDLDAQMAARLPDRFTAADRDELRRALRDITVDGIRRVDADLAELAELETRRARILASSGSPLQRAYELLEVTRLIGTPAFAHLARGAFVATSILRSLVNVGALSPAQLEAYLASVETVLGQMRGDGARVTSGDLSWDELVERYGHLRPGTYDITSPCYRSAAEEYLRPVVDGAASATEPAVHEWSRAQRTAIDEALRGADLPFDLDELDRFARAAISGREYGKFVFTRALSEALELIARFGDELGFSRDDLAHVSIGDLLACLAAMSDRRGFLASRVDEGKEAHHITQGVCLPGQIADADDLTCFEQQAAEPNFVSRLTIQAPVITADDLDPTLDVTGKIVMIPNADPGFDWLLARDIGGLVTMFGGANSHMAVRAAELSLPAAIGVGELLYQELSSAAVLQLDCSSRTIRVIR